MSKRRSDKPTNHPFEESVVSSVAKPDRVKRQRIPFGLSTEQFTRIRREMLVVARLVCGHSGASPEDAVQQALVKALSKRDIEQSSSQDEKKLTARLCELAKWEATTLRNAVRRQAERVIDPGAEISELAVVPPSIGAVEARKMLEHPLMRLEAEDQEVLHALYVEGKSTRELATEQRRPWQTVDSHHRRLRELLYATMKAMVAALLLAPRTARAYVAHVMQRAPYVLVQATQFGGAMSVTMVCGAILPTGSSVMTESSRPLRLAEYSNPQDRVAQVANLQPSFLPEVAPEEPKALDAETNECSAGDMQSTKLSRFLQGTMVPLALSGVPAFTQVACTGAKCQTAPAEQPVDPPTEERDDSHDPYDTSCNWERMHGRTCMPKEEWEKIGLPR